MALSKAILGISPGTRTMGIAVIRDGELVESRVKTFKGTWSKSKLAYILGVIEKVWEYYGITEVVIKKVDPIKSSKQLEVLTNRTIRQMTQKGMKMNMYSIYDLNAATGSKKRHLHSSIAEYVLEIYPGLRGEYLKERNNRREYYSKMFEAVLCAHLRIKGE